MLSADWDVAKERSDAALGRRPHRTGSPLVLEAGELAGRDRRRCGVHC